MEENNQLNATEALFGFCAWLSTREEKITMSASDNPSHIPELIMRFADRNRLPDIREGWEKNLAIMIGHADEEFEQFWPNSSQIKRTKYIPSDSILEVEFKNTGIYHFLNFKAEDFEGLTKAESIGKYFYANIKGKFEYKKIK